MRGTPIFESRLMGCPRQRSLFLLGGLRQSLELVLERLEPRQFQHPASDRLYSAGRLGHRRRDHHHVHHFQTNPNRPQAPLAIRARLVPIGPEGSPPRRTEGSLAQGGRPQPRFCSGRLQAGRLLYMLRHKPQHKRHSASSCLSAIFSPATDSFNCPVTPLIRT